MVLLPGGKRRFFSFGIRERRDTGERNGFWLHLDGGAGLNVAKVDIILVLAFVVDRESKEIAFGKDDFFIGLEVTFVDSKSAERWFESGFKIEDAAVDEVGESTGYFASALAIRDENGDSISG